MINNFWLWWWFSDSRKLYLSYTWISGRGISAAAAASVTAGVLTTGLQSPLRQGSIDYVYLLLDHYCSCRCCCCCCFVLLAVGPCGVPARTGSAIGCPTPARSTSLPAIVWKCGDLVFDDPVWRFGGNKLTDRLNVSYCRRIRTFANYQLMQQRSMCTK